MLKRVVTLTYLALILTMGAATLVEKYEGTAFVACHIYGSWWFCSLWALLAASGVAWLLRRRVRKARVWLLHSSLLVILLGAMLTHLTAYSGMLHLRCGETAQFFMCHDDGSPRKLPFSVRLDQFTINYHPGTSSPSDYVSKITVLSPGDSTTAVISMNHIFAAKGARLYQSSYDDDGRGSWLSVSIDPWGVPASYLGYAMLFLSLLWQLAAPRGPFRQLLRSAEFRKVGAALLLATLSIHGWCAPVLPAAACEELRTLHLDYGGRISLVETYALDFTKKLCGKRRYDGHDAVEVLSGFIFYNQSWRSEPVVRVKDGPLRSHLGLRPRMSFNDFFTDEGYVLGPLLREYHLGAHDKLHREAMEYDDKLQLILSVAEGFNLRLFPYHSNETGRTTWHAPCDSLPPGMEASRRKYIHDIVAVIGREARAGHESLTTEGLSKLRKYQATYGLQSLPSPTAVWAEHIYNAIPFATILFMANLTLAVVSMFVIRRRWLTPLLCLSLLLLTICIALRWLVGDTIPMSNGYETMLLMAWFAELLGLLLSRRIPLMLTFAFLLSGLFLLVSHIGQMSPQITHIMPVLNSPLLSIHVSVIMLAYALLSITFCCGVTALVLRSRADYLRRLSLLFLHPSLSALGIGIFTGAIWANVSWGAYWSWDPKEVWALITLMVYAVGAHDQSLPWLRRPLSYHLYMVAAFLTLLMTYFGVNYFLGGMHSYA